jgi:alpha-glucosidase
MWKMRIQTETAALLLLMTAACMILTGSVCRGEGGRRSVRSPDGRLNVVFTLAGGAPFYEVAYDGRPVVLPSSLGFSFRAAKPLTGGFVIRKAATRSHDETWKPVWGEKSEIRDAYNELLVELREEAVSGRRMNIIFRVYDDGLGFRYVLPKQRNLGSFEIVSEETRFTFAGNHRTWWIPADFDSYEHLYTQSPLGEVKSADTPVTMETADGLYISIHEANLTDYAAMTLLAAADERLTFECNLVPWPDGVKVRGAAPLVTPWRTVQVSETAGGLIESDLILNLNEPNVIGDTSWIRPMKYVGIWWGMHIRKHTWHEGPDHGATTENAKRYIDFAHAHRIPGLLIEGWNTGWEKWGQEGAFNFIDPYPDFDIEEVVSYGRSRGVYIIGHHETGGDVPGYERQIDAAFALYRKLGIPAVKTGYAGAIFPRGQHHHGQWMVNHYRMVVEKAAEYHIMLDVHEPIKPTGIRRTYPNMMTREGVRGMEYNAWSTGNPPEHTTVLPFTRMLAGPADYTPGIFDITFDRYQEDYRVYTTLAKQLALYVVLYSPLQMAADLPENYENQPAFRFIEEVPVDWDDTIVLSAAIGDHVTIARRAGESWFIGSITDEEARVLEIDLSFLERDRPYLARIYADTPYTDWEENWALIDISERLVDRETKLLLRLARGGGQAISLIPADH